MALRPSKVKRVRRKEAEPVETVTDARGNQSEIEVVPDAWERFRSAVHTMTKAGPQHRTPTDKIGSKTGKSIAKRKVKAVFPD
jgi:hypothetical protein